MKTKSKTKIKKTEFDEFLDLVKNEYKNTPYAIVKRIDDYVFTFKARKRNK